MAATGVQNYSLKGIKAHYFTGPRSSDNEFRTMAALLRSVADWIESSDVQDPEFDHLLIKTVFESEGYDEFYESATLYFREENQ